MGESGQIKSTFLSLFCIFYPISNNLYITDNTPQHKVVDVVYISQEVELFDLTIKENLCLGKNFSDDLLNEYLEEAGLTDWVNHLEKRIDTTVGELDIISEEKICNMINKYLKNKTCIIVTHRKKLTEICNKHYIFKNREMKEV